jgi:hypothetical protein
MACWPTQGSGRGDGMATRRASLGHRDLATGPGAGLLDSLTRSRVVGPNPFEPVEDVLGARCRPQGEEMVIRIAESSTAADRHETRVTVFGEDHSQHPFCSHLLAITDGAVTVLALSLVQPDGRQWTPDTTHPGVSYAQTLNNSAKANDPSRRLVVHR